MDDSFYKDDIYVKNSFFYPLSDDEKDDVNIVVQIIRGVDTDITDKVGNIIVYLNEEEIYRDDLFININLSKKKVNIFSKLYLFFKDLVS